MPLTLSWFMPLSYTALGYISQGYIPFGYVSLSYIPLDQMSLFHHMGRYCICGNCIPARELQKYSTFPYSETRL